MAARLLSLVAALVLACASTLAHGYARPLQSESARRDLVADSEIALRTRDAASASRVEEKSPASQDSTSSFSDDAWGNVESEQVIDTALNAKPNRIGFTGYQLDRATSGPGDTSYYAKARHYGAGAGVFRSVDPWQGDAMSPMSLHRYGYAFANPLVYVDPDGREACRGHALENCPLPQYTPPNHAVPQSVAVDALGGAPGLTEVEADRTGALPSSALSPDQHLNSERYRFVPYVDPEGDGNAVRYYIAQNLETGAFDWTVPPGQIDSFLANEERFLNVAAYSRTMGGTTPSNIRVQRALRDAGSGDYTDALGHLGESWVEAGKDPLFYVEVAGSVAGASTIRQARNVRAVTVIEAPPPKAYGVPYRPLSKKQRVQARESIEQRSMTREEYERYRWDQRLQNRRRAGVEEFWDMERERLAAGQPGTRAWSPEQREQILAGETPKFEGRSIEGHHRYGVLEYPQIANDGTYIYPATRPEHVYRWHGGSTQNTAQGEPLNPAYPEEF